MDATFSTHRKFKRMFANLLSLFVILTIAFPLTGSASAQEPNPRIVASITHNWFQAEHFTPGAILTLEILDAPGGSLLWEETRAADESGFVFVGEWEHPVDLVAGNSIVVSDGVTSKDLELEAVTLDVFDPSADYLAGRAPATPAGRFVWVGTGNQNYGCSMDVIADPDNGAWTADFSTQPCDVTEDMWGAAQVFDEDGDASEANPPPSPRIVYRYQGYVVGEHFTPGALLTFSFYESQDASEPLFVMEREGNEFGNASIFEWELPYKLVPRNYVVVTDGRFTKELLLEPVTMDVFDSGLDLLAGTTLPGRSLYIYAQNDSIYCNMDVTADGNGAWTANFSGICDIAEDMWTAAMAMDEDGDVSEATRPSPPPPTPFIAVSLNQEWFMGDYWLPETLVTILVYEFQGATTPFLELSRYTDPSGHLNIEGWEHTGDLEPGNYLTATDGSTTKELLLEYVSLDVFDFEHDVISGMALPGREVGVGVGHANEERWLDVLADEVTGAWTADFSTIGYNLTPDMWAGAHVGDEDGDVTSAHNSGRSLPPVPHIVASLTEDWFYLLNFPPNAPVDLSIYESQGGTQLWSGTATTDDSGFVWIDAEERWSIELGTYLVASDGTLTKDLVVGAFTFDSFDVTRGLLEGTAPEPFGRRVWVGFGWDYGGWFLDITTNKKGAWTADFDSPVPNGYQWVAAQIFDADGDATELRPALIIDRTVSAGNFYVEWSTTNPEEVIELRWKNSVNLTYTFGYSDSSCPEDIEFFGNSWVSENEGTDPFFFASLVGWGTTGTWKEQTSTKVKIGSKSSGCPASADIPIKTDYQFFDDELRANLMVVQRMFKFGDIPYAHDVRPFIPRLYPSDGFTEVLHPNATSDELVTDTTCDLGCIAASWDGSWFAIHNPVTGVGMIVQRKPSAYAAALWLDDDDGSFTNASSMLLLQPEGGFTGTVTETEYLCFYDSNTWTPSLTLPEGCLP